MMNINSRVAMLYAAVVSIAVLLPSADAAAKRGHDRGRHIGHVASPHHGTFNLSVGRHVGGSPYTHHVVRVGGNSHLYYNGSLYYPPSHGVHLTVNASIGSRVRHLSPGYVSFGIGSHRYYYSNFTYYRQNSRTQEYIVVEEPRGAEAAVAAASESSSGEIFVYPNLGQSNEQRDRDRYECYLWAVEQTSFDPSAANPDLERADAYRRASAACLQGRGYTVK